MSGNGEILSVKGVNKRFGGIQALRDLDIAIDEGEIHGIIGPNGAGKSTFFDVVSGILPVTAGQIYLRGREITTLPAEKIARMGVARTFQKGRLVAGMTVLDNVMAGIYSYNQDRPIKSFFLHPVRFRRQEEEIRERALSSLNFVGMEQNANRWSDDLVWVERQLVQIARALISSPGLLLMDEPNAGMGAPETGKVEEIILKIREKGITVVVISHDLNLVMNLCDRITAIDFGEKISEGPPGTVRNDPRVLEAYIGE